MGEMCSTFSREDKNKNSTSNSSNSTLEIQTQKIEYYKNLIKKILNEVLEWIYLPWNVLQYREILNSVMKFGVPYIVVKFLDT